MSQTVTESIELSHIGALAEGSQSAAASQMSRRSSIIDDRPPTAQAMQELPKMDSGFAAYKFLAAAWAIEAAVWGYSYAYGSYLSYHQHDERSPFHSSPLASVSAVGTLVIGCQHFTPLLTRGFFRAYPHLVRKVTTTCLVLSSLALIAASFVRNVTLLILLQGLVYGIASGIIFTPVIIWLPQWYDKRAGLATGILFSGSGIGGLVFPILISSLLRSVGFAWTLRIWAALSGLVGAAAIIVLRPRLPPAKPDYRGLTHKQYLSLLLPGDLRPALSSFGLLGSAVNLCQAAGWYTVSLYIETYAISLGLSAPLATGVLSAFNGAATLSYLVMGRMLDLAPYNLVIVASNAACGVLALLLLGFSNSLALILVFVLTFGLAGGGFSTTLTPISRELALAYSRDTATFFLAFTAVRGLAAVFGPLLAGVLYQIHQAGVKSTYGAYGLRGIVVFVGCAMLGASFLASFFGVATRPLRKQAAAGAR